MKIIFGKFLGFSVFEIDTWGWHEETSFPSNVRIIGKGSCYNFDKLESIKIPFGVKVIEDSAFESCKELYRVIFEDGILLTKIGKRVFSNCKKLRKIEIPLSVKLLGDGAFENCIKLRMMTFVEDSYLESIGNKTFYGCESLTNIELPLRVKKLGKSAFENCIELQTVTFVEDSYLESIGDNAFKGCTYLSSIVIPKNVLKMGKDVFIDCPYVTIFCECDEKPDSWPDDWNNGRPVIWGCKRTEVGYYSFIYGEKDNKVYAYIDKFDNNQVTDFKIPDTINGKEYISTGLNMSLFRENKVIKSVVLPSGVTSIANQTFWDCNYLIALTIPNSVKSFGTLETLFCCYHLGEIINESNVEIPDFDSRYIVHKKEESRLIYADDGFVLQKYENDITVVAYTGNNRNIIVPDIVTSIKRDVFRCYKNVVSIFVPLSVNFLEFCAFAYCDGLKSIKYEGTIKDWEKIKKDKNWYVGLEVECIACKDGDIEIKKEE